MKQLFSLQKISVSALALFLFCLAQAGDPVFKVTGAREAAMGCIMPVNNPFWSAFQNQGSLGRINAFTAGINYEEKFFLRELGRCTAAAALPAGKARLAALYSYFGYSDYNRRMTAVACGLPLSENVSAGIQIDYFNEKTYGEYSAWHSVTCEAGMLIAAAENLYLGIQVFNPVPNSIRKSDLPTRLKLDVTGNLNTSLLAGAGIEMSTGENPCLYAGIEYGVSECFWLRGGFRSENSSFSFGIGYHIKPVVIDIAFYSHEKLGISSNLSMIFNFNNKIK